MGIFWLVLYIQNCYSGLCVFFVVFMMSKSPAMPGFFICGFNLSICGTLISFSMGYIVLVLGIYIRTVFCIGL